MICPIEYVERSIPGILQPEYQQPDDGDDEDGDVDKEEILTCPAAIYIDDELDDGKNPGNHGEKDHCRHGEEAKKVCNPGKTGYQEQGFIGTGIFQIDFCPFL